MRLSGNHRICYLFPKRLLLALIIYIAFTHPATLLFQHFGEATPFTDFNTIVFGLISALYGFTRVQRFHPAYNSSYLIQLALSPWEYRNPLPRGPVHLVWVDAVILCGLSLLALTIPMYSPWVPLISFLAAYTVGLFISFCLTDQSGYIACYLVLAPLCVYPHLRLHGAIVVLLVLAGMGLWGVRSYLHQFPWNTAWWNKKMVDQLKQNALARHIIQWPFRELTLPQGSFSVTPREGLFLGLLVFWWVHVIEWAVRLDNSSILFLYPFAIAIMVLIRHCGYTGKCRPPVSILGRLYTGRIIIPGYDKIYLAPVAIVLCGIFFPMILKYFHITNPLALEVSVAVTLFVALTFPPSLESWRYTGHFQIASPPAHRKKNNFRG